jgi:hypothetical protein
MEHMMSQVDEGLIHAWLDGQLSGADAERVARLVATDPAWESAAAEARGLIAGSSRVLSALDDVPHVRNAAQSAGTRRSVWRTSWLRAAASVVFVAGITGLVLREFGGGVGADEERTPVAAADVPAPAPPSTVPPASTRPQQQSAVREEKAAAGPRPAAALEARAGTRVATEVRDTVANTIRGKVADAARGPVDTPAVSAQRVTLTAPPLPLVEQGVVGAVSPSGLRIDGRLAGCWVQIDSAGAPVSFVSPAPEMDAVARDVVGLRFIAPVATDLPLATRMGAGRGGGRGGRAGSEPSRSLAPQPRLTAMPMNATTRMLADSSYAAEFVDARGRAEMTFTVAGDTIRGTMRRSAADVRFPVVAFRAVRAECPQ